MRWFGDGAWENMEMGILGYTDDSLLVRSQMFARDVVF